MNSLYKMYIKRGAWLLFIGLLLTLAVTYMSYTAFITNSPNTDGGTLLSAVDGFAQVYTARCFFINIILSAILLYGLYSGRNRHTGIFVRSLPVKGSQDFITKLAVLLCFIVLISALDILIFNIVMKLKLEGVYTSSWEYLYNVRNVQTHTLQDLYSYFYEDVFGFLSITLVFSTAAMFFCENMGVTGFAIIMPAIALMLLSGFLTGLQQFLTAIDTDISGFAGVINHSFRNISLNYNHMKFTVGVFGRYIPLYAFYIIFGSLISAILVLLAFAGLKISENSRAGSLFLSPCFRRLAYFIGTVTGGFSFWLSIDLLPSFGRLSNTLTWNFIILALCFLFSYYIISRLEKLFS